MIREAFAPTTALGFVGTGAALVLLVVAGGLIQRSRNAALGWGALALGVAAAHLLTLREPAGYRMLALCSCMLYGMKAVVGQASTAAGHAPLGPLRWIVFTTLWMGMRPSPFRSLGGPARRGAPKIAWLGVRNIAFGLALLFGARAAASRDADLLAYLLGLPALSLLVHFGLFHLQVALYRSNGVDVAPIFRNPPLSGSLREFWGRRWNLAFSEMTSLAVHRPLRGRLGNGRAVSAAFLFSGVLHELAISAPVQAGWGLPMAYFAMHAAAMALEQKLRVQGIAGRLWTYAWILAPLPLLFHAPFRDRVVGPLLGIG